MTILRNLRFETNSDLQFSVRWESESEVPYALSDAVLQVREEPGSDIIIEATVANGRIVLDPEDGWAHVLISAADIAALPVFEYAQYDLVLWRVLDGSQTRAAEGKVVYSAGISG